ncbi:MULTISPECIES: TetR/AcrR family transcriptional regulator [unclassified Solwaraspora]|uniref:TetR/AcrR family transcriptional regulator n=1 Tax=unclassified Solwaraspora TaxID=2627926 RepID=UPI00248C61DF|nr:MULTISPECIES: TetR/AcrR family transcriptional regulator [unclassified Solwaraspora]WBB95104.1 TetR/AcrR family transcriptional regulator [Solwaraspora sp. WMMA2059]WBC21012.1 TetR/AcrR family transcriptional regulator [Solwaraspora sp. WMMA2080]WJK36897.1 TetR/AcrR family transcriptional regulator [Solwaraspora sp. WMMA2065]
MQGDGKRPPAGAAVLREDVTQAIRAAALQELAAVGYGRMSIEAVARRAGVGKTAVYRRWGSKLEMVIGIVSEVAVGVTAVPDSGSLRGDLELVLTIAARALRHPLAGQIVPDLLAEAARNPAIAQTLQAALRDNQRGIGTLVTNRAVRRGELPADTDPDFVVDLMVGPLYWRLAVARTPLPRGYVARLAASVAGALTAGAATDPAANPATGPSVPPATG